MSVGELGSPACIVVVKRESQFPLPKGHRPILMRLGGNKKAHSITPVFYFAFLELTPNVSGLG